MYQCGWLHDLSVAHIHTPSCILLVRTRSFRASSPAYPHDPLFADRLLSTIAPFPSDWWLHLLSQARTSTTIPLAVQLTRAFR